MEKQRQQVIATRRRWGDLPPTNRSSRHQFADSGCEDCDQARVSLTRSQQQQPLSTTSSIRHLSGSVENPPTLEEMTNAGGDMRRTTLSVSTKDWNYEDLLSSGDRFRPVDRVHATSESLLLTIKSYEETGIPLIIEGWHQHPRWAQNFNLEYFEANSNSEGMINVRNVHDGQDSRISISEFTGLCRQAPIFASQEETERLYGKDAECPQGWREWLEKGDVIPSCLIGNGPRDLFRYRSESERIETLMCYLGIGDTFTPAHKDLCASSGQNLMCYTENEGASFWFMTEGSDAPEAASYFQSLDQELDHETHVITPEQLTKTPFRIYVAKQVLGDLVLVPPRSCHQVVNSGGITLKTSWSRMTLQGLVKAYYHELPIYRRVCRLETYRVKSTIFCALREQTKELQNLTHSPHRNSPSGPSDSISPSRSSTPATTKFPLSNSRHDLRLSPSQLAQQKELAANILKLIELADDIFAEEYAPKSQKVTCLRTNDDNADHRIVCDFCGADIFQSFFECLDCANDVTASPDASGSIVICPGCYVEGRSCKCLVMEPMQCQPFEELIQTRNNALNVLRHCGGDKRLRSHISSSDLEQSTMNPTTSSVFRAACVLLNYRINKNATKVCNRHCEVETSALHCRGCHSSKCFEHILKLQKTHAVEALIVHHADSSAKDDRYHKQHLDNKTRFAANSATIQQSQRDGTRPDISMSRVHHAMKYGICKPVVSSRIALGFYDVAVQVCDSAGEDFDSMLAEQKQPEISNTAPQSPQSSISSLTPYPESDFEESLCMLDSVIKGPTSATILPMPSDTFRAEPRSRKWQRLDYVLVPPAPYPIHHDPKSKNTTRTSKTMENKFISNTHLHSISTSFLRPNRREIARVPSATPAFSTSVSKAKNHKITGPSSSLRARMHIHPNNENPGVSKTSSKGKQRATSDFNRSTAPGANSHKTAIMTNNRVVVRKGLGIEASTSHSRSIKNGGKLLDEMEKGLSTSLEQLETSLSSAKSRKRKRGQLDSMKAPISSPQRLASDEATASGSPSVPYIKYDASYHGTASPPTADENLEHTDNSTVPLSLQLTTGSSTRHKVHRFKSGLVIKLDDSLTPKPTSKPPDDFRSPRYRTLLSSVSSRPAKPSNIHSIPYIDSVQSVPPKNFASLADAMNSAGSHNAKTHLLTGHQVSITQELCQPKPFVRKLSNSTSKNGVPVTLEKDNDLEISLEPIKAARDTGSPMSNIHYVSNPPSIAQPKGPDSQTDIAFQPGISRGAGIHDSRMYVLIPVPPQQVQLHPPHPDVQSHANQDRHATHETWNLNPSQAVHYWPPSPDVRQPSGRYQESDRRYDSSYRNSGYRQDSYPRHINRYQHRRNMHPTTHPQGPRNYSRHNFNPYQDHQHPLDHSQESTLRPQRPERESWDRDYDYRVDPQARANNSGGCYHSNHVRYHGNRGSDGPPQKYRGRVDDALPRSRWLKAAMADELPHLPPSHKQDSIPHQRPNLLTPTTTAEIPPPSNNLHHEGSSHRQQESQTDCPLNHSETTHQPKMGTDRAQSEFWEDRYVLLEETAPPPSKISPNPVASPVRRRTGPPGKNPVPEPYPELENPWKV